MLTHVLLIKAVGLQAKNLVVRPTMSPLFYYDLGSKLTVYLEYRHDRARFSSNTNFVPNTEHCQLHVGKQKEGKERVGLLRRHVRQPVSAVE